VTLGVRARWPEGLGDGWSSNGAELMAWGARRGGDGASQTWWRCLLCLPG
jgi:hypothetical protein